MLVERMIRAARLDPELYNEVEHDRTATGQAFAVVLIVAVCALIGSAFGGYQTQNIFQASASAILKWLICSLIILGVGRVLGGTADFGEVMRTLAFAYTPRVLTIFAFFPLLGGLVSFIAWVWTLIATIVAIREAMDFDTGRAVLTVVIPYVAVMVMASFVAIAFGLAFFTFWI